MSSCYPAARPTRGSLKQVFNFFEERRRGGGGGGSCSSGKGQRTAASQARQRAATLSSDLN